MGNAFRRGTKGTLMPAIEINSDAVLADIEHHFRITAGPGAGKTYWLVNHLKHVVRTSGRLTPCSRIAVLSYTNVAVREIGCRLGPASDSIEASTIHSFLFRNVVRPYVHVLKGADGIDLVAHQRIDTHNEHHPSRTLLDEWLAANGQSRLRASGMSELYEYLKQRLRSLTARIDADGNAYLAPCRNEARDKPIKALLAPNKILEYKQKYWRQGTIDHEDVLYFAHRLLNENVPLRRFLSARFPYLFIDEFQDTIPVQAMLVRWLAEQGTVVGVIGDPEQAIFGFLDASPRHFRDFSLDGHQAYSIPDNRRSSDNIVQFLNTVRTDGLKQKAVRAVPGAPLTVYGGDLSVAIAEAQKAAAKPLEMLILARTHKSLLRVRGEGAAMKVNPWEQLEEVDVDRFRLLHNMVVSVDLALRGFCDLAVQRLIHGICSRRGFRKPFTYDGTADVMAKRNAALFLLELAMKRQEQMLGQTALEFYQLLMVEVSKCDAGLKLPKVQKGKGFYVTASVCSYAALFECLSSPDPVRNRRVIHQAKGAEADAVFLILDDKQIGHILTPAVDDEEQRTTYVALSRARDNLSLFCPIAAHLADFEKLPHCTTRLMAPKA